MKWCGGITRGHTDNHSPDEYYREHSDKIEDWFMKNLHYLAILGRPGVDLIISGINIGKQKIRMGLDK
jgi:hypothetical protein